MIIIIIIIHCYSYNPLIPETRRKVCAENPTDPQLKMQSVIEDSFQSKMIGLTKIITMMIHFQSLTSLSKRGWCKDNNVDDDGDKDDVDVEADIEKSVEILSKS